MYWYRDANTQEILWTQFNFERIVESNVNTLNSMDFRCTEIDKENPFWAWKTINMIYWRQSETISARDAEPSHCIDAIDDWFLIGWLMKK